MAQEDLQLSEASALERLADVLIARIDGRKNETERVSAEAEEKRCAAVKALQRECEAEEEKIRKSPEFKAYPLVGAVALRFGWTHAEFLENLARAGQVKLVAVAA